MTDRLSIKLNLFLSFPEIARGHRLTLLHRESDRHTETYTDTEAHRQTQRQTHKQK